MIHGSDVKVFVMTSNRFLCAALVAALGLGGAAVGSTGMAWSSGMTLPDTATSAPMPRPDTAVRPMPRPASEDGKVRPMPRPTEQLASIQLGF